MKRGYWCASCKDSVQVEVPRGPSPTRADCKVHGVGARTLGDAPAAASYSKPGSYGTVKDMQVTELPPLSEASIKRMADPSWRRKLEDEKKRKHDEDLGGQKRKRNHLLRWP